MKRQFLLITLLLIIATPSFSQQWSFSTGLGYTLFLGDIGGTIPAPGFAINSEIWYELNQKFTLKMGGSIYSLKGNDANRDRNRSFRSRNMESYVALMYTYKKPHHHWYHRKKVWRPFWYLGLGLTSVDPAGKTGTKEYNADLKVMKPEGNSLARVAIMVPFGFGVKLELSRQHAIVFDGGFRYAFSDDLDGVSKSTIDKSSLSGSALGYYSKRNVIAGGNPKSNDIYWLASVKLQYIPIDKRRKSKYRRKVTYPKYGYKRRRK